MARSKYTSSLGPGPSKSISVTSMDDPPPPPPPRMPKSKSKESSHGGGYGTSFDTSIFDSLPQSRHEDDNNSRHSKDKSHASSKSSKMYLGRQNRDRAGGRDGMSIVSNDSRHSRGSRSSFSAPPPPPPPGEPPTRRKQSSSSRSRSAGQKSLDQISESNEQSSRTSRKRNSEKEMYQDDDSHGSRTSSKASSHFSGPSQDDRKSHSSRRGQGSVNNSGTKESHPESANDADSVDTEVLRFGQDDNASQNSTAKESVAERRRRKAKAASESSQIQTPVRKSEMKSTSEDKVENKVKDKIYEDPPLELYSEDSESDDSDYRDDKAMNQKGKKKNGFSRVKNLIRMGKTSNKSAPKLKTPSQKGGRKTSMSPGRNQSRSPKKGNFLTRFSPDRRRSVTPENRRGRAAVQSDKTKRGLSPFRFRSRSRSRSKSRVNDSKPEAREKSQKIKRKDDKGAKSKRSGEIIVDKKKLLEHEKRKNEAAKFDIRAPDSEERSRKSASKSVSKSIKSAGNEKSTFEELRSKREERRLQEMEKKKGHLQDGDLEIVSGSNSDDVSEMTDPTYVTKREDNKNNHLVRDLNTVEERASPTKSLESRGSLESRDSPTSKSRDRRGSPTAKSFQSRGSVTSKSRNTEHESVQYSLSKSRSNSPQSRSNKSRSNSPQSRSNKSRSTVKSEQNEMDDWNPDNFNSGDKFVATIDPFKTAARSKDPFDEPFYPAGSKDDQPKQMFSFVYSESDAELEREGPSKDTMTGLSFDSEEEEVSNTDGLSFATPAGQSETTQITKNNAESNLSRSKRLLLPPGETLIPDLIENEQKARALPSNSRGRDAFLGIDEDSGAVTMNVVSDEKESAKVLPHKPMEMGTGGLSQKALNRSRKGKGFLEYDDDSLKVNKVRANVHPKIRDRESRHARTTKSPERNIYRSGSSKKPVERSLKHSPSFIIERREKRKAREKELERKAKMDSKSKYHLLRGKSDVNTAIERGRRREKIFERPSDPGFHKRTYSPDKLKFALDDDRSRTSTKALARGDARSPHRGTQRENKKIDEENSWFERPHFDTRSIRHLPRASPSTRAVFKAPAVFGAAPLESPFKAPEPYNRRTDPVLASVAHIEDPIQRAGAMILSAAAIPIQAEMRRYLAVRHREDRTWAIIVAQAYFRRWKAELTRYKYLYCATRIQAAFRGWLVRDTIEDKHYCATQIQKIARGYLATMRVYEDLYNITVVQSIVRRNAAIRAAEKRYRNICTVQAILRGRQCRREMSYLHWSATKIQTAWRTYTAQLNYQFDIVDIIIVQSIARRKAAMTLAKNMQDERIHNAATTIQKTWRSYDCTMNYLHSVADVLIAQSIVRRWIAKRYVTNYRNDLHFKMSMRIQMCARAWISRIRIKKQRAARDIQKVWRGFWCYTDYVFTLADIIVVQKMVRGYQARKRTAALAQLRKEKNHYNAAVIIQKTWRGYSAQMEMLFSLVHIIIVQSVVRRRIARNKFKPRILEYRAASRIQANWLIYLRKRNFMQNYCATIIQAKVRRHQAIILRQKMIAARCIQAWYRCQATSRGYSYYISARKIQTIWRGYDARKLADEERWVREYAATTIQKTWRRFYQYSSYAIYKHEKKAATDIQRHWRGFWDYSHFVIMRYEACKIQAVVRGVQQRKRLAQHNRAAVTIQAGARCLLAKKTCHMERLFAAMVSSAQLALSEKIASRKIQRAFRVYNEKVKQKRAALVIERFFIWVRAEVEREIERREKLRIKKRQEQRRRKKREDDDLLENAYNAVNTPVRNRNDPVPNSQKHLKKSLRDSVRKMKSGAAYKSNQLSHLAVDVDDTGSDVSGLTAPTVTSPRFKVKNKEYNDKVDDELEGAWHEAKRKQGLSAFGTRPITRESQKENSSTFTPNLKLSARSLSRNREELRRARVT